MTALHDRARRGHQHQQRNKKTPLLACVVHRNQRISGDRRETPRPLDRHFSPLLLLLSTRVAVATVAAQLPCVRQQRQPPQWNDDEIGLPLGVIVSVGRLGDRTEGHCLRFPRYSPAASRRSATPAASEPLAVAVVV